MYQENTSTLPFVKTLWYAKVEKLGQYGDQAKDTWSLSFTLDTAGQYGAVLVGPNFEYRQLDTQIGDQYWGAELLPFYTVKELDKHKYTGLFMNLPVRDDKFELGGSYHHIPTYQQLDSFLAKLAEHGIIYQAETATSLAQKSLRSKQRGYRRVIGLTRKQLDQIRRAERAASLLVMGMSPAEVADTVGYADQAHLTRALKILLGKTPSQFSE